MPDLTTMWAKVPNPDMTDGLRRYYEHGIPPSSFLRALLENSLIGALATADMANTARLRDWAAWIYEEFDGAAHGSPEKVSRWIAHGGLSGQAPRE